MGNAQILSVFVNIVHVHDVWVVDEFHDDHLALDALHDAFSLGVVRRGANVDFGDDLDSRQLARLFVSSETNASYNEL